MLGRLYIFSKRYIFKAVEARWNAEGENQFSFLISAYVENFKMRNFTDFKIIEIQTLMGILHNIIISVLK